MVGNAEQKQKYVAVLPAIEFMHAMANDDLTVSTDNAMLKNLALADAVRRDSTDTVLHLLDNGADPLYLYKGESLITLAKVNNNLAVLSRLVDACLSELDQLLVDAIKANQTDVALLLLDKGANALQLHDDSSLITVALDNANPIIMNRLFDAYIENDKRPVVAIHDDTEEESLCRLLLSWYENNIPTRIQKLQDLGFNLDAFGDDFEQYWQRSIEAVVESTTTSCDEKLALWNLIPLPDADSSDKRLGVISKMTLPAKGYNVALDDFLDNIHFTRPAVSQEQKSSDLRLATKGLIANSVVCTPRTAASTPATPTLSSSLLDRFPV